MLQQYKVRTASSTGSDRCLGLRIRPRCANAFAAPLSGLTCRATRASDLETKRSNAPSTHLSWLRIIREYAAGGSHRAGLGCHAKLLGTSLRGKTVKSAQALVLESGAARRAFGAALRGARHSSSRRWLDFFSPSTTYC